MISRMSESLIKGNISFVNHEKKYVLIEYEQNGRKKTVNGGIDEKIQQIQKDRKLIKKIHRFHIGDTVCFKVKTSGHGDRMMAVDIQYLYNNGLDALINKAKTANNFTGYLKVANDKYFVKEIETYIFFPVPFSPWQIQPTDSEMNEAVGFSLENLINKEKITASLYHKKFIPEYYAAVKAFKTQTPVDSEIFRITPHAVYLQFLGNKFQAKLGFSAPTYKVPTYKVGDKLKILISFLSESRVIVKEVPIGFTCNKG